MKSQSTQKKLVWRPLWALLRSGGSIGEDHGPYPIWYSGRTNKLIKVSIDRALLLEERNKSNASLSPGDKSYYHIKYAVIKLSTRQIKELEAKGLFGVTKEEIASNV